jgi:hypothetical protein
LQWCIEQGFVRFEGGAQGEHKMARGLLPVATPLRALAARRSALPARWRDFLAARGSRAWRSYVDELAASATPSGRRDAAGQQAASVRGSVRPPRAAESGALPSRMHLDPLAGLEVLVVLEEVLDRSSGAPGCRSSGFCQCV